MLSDNVDRFLSPAAAGDDIFDHENPFAGSDFKTASENESVVLFFGENVSFSTLARNFLTDHEAADRRSENGFEFDAFKLLKKQFGEPFDFVEILADLRRLEKIFAVKSGSEDEMSFEERFGFAKNVENFGLCIVIHEKESGGFCLARQQRAQQRACGFSSFLPVRKGGFFRGCRANRSRPGL